MTTPKQLFGVMIRGFGLYNIMSSLYYFLTALYHPYATPGINPASVMMLNLMYGICYFLAGVYLLRGAPGLFRFCYSEAAASSDTKG